MSRGDSTGGEEEKTIVLLVKKNNCVITAKCSFPIMPRHSHFYFTHLRFQITHIYDGCLLVTEQQKTDSQHFPSRQFIQRRPGPPTMVPSKNHVSSSITNPLASMNALFNSSPAQALLPGHSNPSTTASGSSGNSNNNSRSTMNEMSAHGNVGPGNTTQMTQSFAERKNEVYFLVDFL